MRFILIAVMLALSACGQESSPEGRMTLKAEKIQASIDSLKVQNKVIFDSLASIRKEIAAMKLKPGH